MNSAQNLAQSGLSGFNSSLMNGMQHRFASGTPVPHGAGAGASNTASDRQMHRGFIPIPRASI